MYKLIEHFNGKDYDDGQTVGSVDEAYKMVHRMLSGQANLFVTQRFDVRNDYWILAWGSNSHYIKVINEKGGR